MFAIGRTILSSGRRISTSAVLNKPWLFVGLGNPGDKYKSTRHNVGFDMIDTFSQSLGITMNTVHFKALFGEGLVGEVPVLLAKPQTYMNLSGESAGPLAAYYKLPLDRVVLIFDDMELPCGVLRLQPRGGHGGHKGVMNVIQHFRGNRDFARLRIGIGKPPGQMDPKAYVLQKFNATARDHLIYPESLNCLINEEEFCVLNKQYLVTCGWQLNETSRNFLFLQYILSGDGLQPRKIDASLQEGVTLLKTVIEKGLSVCASSLNTEQKYKHLRGCSTT